METKGRTDEKVRMLRREGMEKRARLDEGDRRLKSAQIAEKLFCLPVWKEAQNLLVYVSCAAEVFTHKIIETALAQGKHVFCPKVIGRTMEFYRIRSFAELKPGFRGILEPERNDEIFSKTKPALVLVPGTAFDKEGHRIGYGGGYYDRYLGSFSADGGIYCIGLCFSCQLADRIEPMEHDFSMDLVIWDGNALQ